MLGQTAARGGEVIGTGVEQVRLRIAPKSAVAGVLLNRRQDGL
jgi:hypothetical protein